jgi:hypothetical protein
LWPDLSIDDISVSLFIQITNTKIKNIIVGVIYKPPDMDVKRFNENLEKTLKIITRERRPCYLMGDLNINLLKQHVHSPTKHFLDTLLAHGFFPLINKPTRITTESVTLIDNIFTNVHDPQTKFGIWLIDISDHLPVFTILANNIKNGNVKKKISKRSFIPENFDKFKNDLELEDWSHLDILSDVNTMYTAFIRTVQKLYDKAFPIQTKTLKQQEIHRPWLTKAIRVSISKKHSLFNNYQKHRSPESYSIFKAYRNKLTTILRNAEKMHYLHKLESIKENSAKTWKILNTIISRTAKKESIQEIVHNNKIIFDPKQIANKFNQFFYKCWAKLSSKISPNLTNSLNILKQILQNLFS